MDPVLALVLYYNLIMPSTTRNYTNAEISEYLQNIATAYEIKRKNKFRVTAYQNAADTVSSYPENIYHLWLKDPKSLDHVPNIGPSIIKKIDYFFKFGRINPKIIKNINPLVFTFTKINGIGPLIARKLTQNLKFSPNPVRALDQLVAYAQKNKISALPAFGERSQKLILDNTLAFLGRQTRLPLAAAQKLAQLIIAYLQKKFPQIKFIPLGSLRRQTPTVGDIDLAAAANNPQSILTHFIAYPKSVQTISLGQQEASIRLLHDIHVDLMVKPPQSFGALLQHLTGSRQHNILLRKHALKLGYSLSEYGIKNIKTRKTYRFDSEEKFYNFLGFKWIPPQERVGENELFKYQNK